jgi:hypothetical protein
MYLQGCGWISVCSIESNTTVQACAVAVNYVLKPTLRSNNDGKAAANAAVCPRCDIKIEYKRSFYLFFDNMLYYLRAQWLNMNNIIHTKPLF